MTADTGVASYPGLVAPRPQLARPRRPSVSITLRVAGPVALLIGNEGNGIPDDLAAKADGALTIPCPGPVESLNAAVAASVLLYEASQQRSVRSRGAAFRLPRQVRDHDHDLRQ